MKIITVHHRESKYEAQLNEGIDLSIPLEAGPGKVAAWYVPPIEMEPVRTEQFTGSVAEGGAVNFRNVFFNPHGHGTHTECLGHITETVHSVNKNVTDYHCFAELISVHPQKVTSKFDSNCEDLVITLKDVQPALEKQAEALIIRTLPNTENKQASTTALPTQPI